MIKLSIIIVNWNSAAVLNLCLQSIYKFTKKYNFEIIVVDNNSSDDSCKMIEENYSSVVLISNDFNYGFAAANNQALKICKGELILLLNPDTELTNSAIDDLIDFHDTSEFDLVTCKLLNKDGSLQKSVFSFHNSIRAFFENRMVKIINLSGLSDSNLPWISKLWKHDCIKEIDWARGAVLLFGRQVLDKVGLLDENFFIYAEEIDFYLRSREAGFKAGFTPYVSIIHYGGVSTGQRKYEMVVQNYRSYYYFLKKHFTVVEYYFYRMLVITGLFSKFLKSYIRGNKDVKLLSSKLLSLHFRKDGL